LQVNLPKLRERLRSLGKHQPGELLRRGDLGIIPRESVPWRDKRPGRL
jgi:hypothetical protein